MSRSIAYFLVCALGVGSAIALVSCGGGGGAELLPGNTARQISENLESVEQLVSDGDCVGAQDAAQQIGEQIDELGGVDKTLKAALRQGAGRLDEAVASECSAEATETIAPASIPEPSESPDTETTTKKPGKGTPTVETNTTPTPTTTSTPTTPTVPTTPTAPTTPPTTPTVPPTESGESGAPSSGGVGPAGSAGEG